MWMLLAGCAQPVPDAAAPAPDPEPVVPEVCRDGAPEGVLYVAPEIALPGDGSAAYPFDELQDAMDAAVNGTEIRMAPGVYPHGGSATDPTRHQHLVVTACEPGTVEIDDSVVFAGRSSAALVGARLEGVEVRGPVVAVRVQPMDFVDVSVRYDNAVALVIEESTARFEGEASVVFVGGVEPAPGQYPAAVQVEDADVEVVGTVTVTNEDIGDGWIQGRGSLTVTGTLEASSPSGRLGLWAGDAPLAVTGTLRASSGGYGATVEFAEAWVGPEGSVEAEGGEWGIAAFDGAAIVVEGRVEARASEAGIAALVQGPGAVFTVAPGGHLEVAGGVTGVSVEEAAELVIAGTTHVGEGAGWGVVAIAGGAVRLDGALEVDGPRAEQAVQVQAGSLEMGEDGTLAVAGGAYGFWATDGATAHLGTVTLADPVEGGLLVSGASTLTLAGPVRLTHAGVHFMEGSTGSVLDTGSLEIDAPSGVGLFLDESGWDAAGPVVVTTPGHEGIRIEGGAATFADTEVTGPVYTGVHVVDAEVSLTGLVVRDTSPEGYGDAVALDGGSLQLSDARLEANPRAGVLVARGRGSVTDTHISGGAWSVVQTDCSQGTIVVSALDATGTTDPDPHLCDGVPTLTPAP